MQAMIVPSVSHVKRAFRAHGSQLQVLRPHGAGQAVVGARTVVPDRLTPERARWRGTMREQSQVWASLTREEKQSWHDYAGRYGPQLEALRTRPSCEPFHGYRVFSAAASNLLAQGLAPCRTAPARAPFDEVPAIRLVSLQPVLRLRVEHPLGTLSGYALQLRIAPPTTTRSATPRRKHVRPICGTVANSTFALLPSGSTLGVPAPAVSLNLAGRTGIEARLLRLSDGMAGPWAWFVMEPPASPSDDRDVCPGPAGPAGDGQQAGVRPGQSDIVWRSGGALRGAVGSRDDARFSLSGRGLTWCWPRSSRPQPFRRPPGQHLVPFGVRGPPGPGLIDALRDDTLFHLLAVVLRDPAFQLPSGATPCRAPPRGHSSPPPTAIHSKCAHARQL